MAQGLSPYLTGNFPADDASNLTPTLQQLMASMNASGQSVAGQDVPPVQMPTTPMPQAQAIEMVKQQLSPRIPKPIANRPSVPALSQQAARRDDWEMNVKKSLGEQDAGLSSLENYINEFAKQPVQLDLSPLAAYSDSLSGGKLSSVQPGMSAEAKQDKLLKLQDLLQQRRGSLAANALAPYKAELAAYKDLMRMQMAGGAGGKQERFEEGLDVRMFDKARKEQAGFTKDVGDFVNSYRNVENAITPDADGTVSVGRLNQSLSQFARLMGEKGVLTDTDTGRQLAPTLEVQMSRLQSILGSDPNARVPASNVAAMTDALVAAKQAYKESYGMKAQSFKNTYFENPGSPYHNKPWAPVLVEELYKPLELINKNTQPVAAPADPARARLEELRRKAGGG